MFLSSTLPTPTLVHVLTYLSMLSYGSSSPSLSSCDPSQSHASFIIPDIYGSGLPPLFFPYYSTHIHTQQQPQQRQYRSTDPTTAVIFIHGLKRDADTYFCDGVSTTIAAGAINTTLVIAPYFPNSSLSSSSWDPSLPSNVSSSSWTDSSWMSGQSDDITYTTSYDVMDQLMNQIMTTYPSIEMITAVGFSAGAQMISRYAIVTQQPQHQQQYSQVTATTPILRFIVSDASSYLYLDQSRPDSLCTPLYDTSVNITCTSWHVPQNQDDCDDYNQYKYGLDGINSYSPYFLNLSISDILSQVPRLDIRYIFGTLDTCNCNTPGFSNDDYCIHSSLTCTPNESGTQGCCDTYPDADTENALAVVCQAMIQGSNRLQRGVLYMSYLSHLYPSAPSSWPIWDVFDGGHDNVAMYASNAFQTWAYQSTQ